MTDFQYPPLNPDDVPIDTSQSRVEIEHTTVINKTAVPSADQSGSPATSAGGMSYSGKVNWGPTWAGKQHSFVVGSSYGEGDNGESGASDNIDGVNDQQGFQSPSGARVMVSGGPHNESIEIVHSSGAQVRIAPDGSISIVAGPSVGLASTTGDTNLAASKKITVSGAEVFVEAQGQLSLKSTSSSVSIEAKGDIILDASGSMQLRTDKRLVMSSGHDTSITAVDSFVVTTGNEASIQAASKFNVDARSSKIKTERANELHAGQNFVIKGKTDSTMSSKEKVTVASGNDLKLEGGTSAYIKSKDAVTLEGKNTAAIKSKIINLQSEGGSAYVDVSEGFIVTSKLTTLSATENFTTISDITTMNATNGFNVHAGGAMDLRGDTIDLNKAAPDPETPQAPEVTSPEEPAPTDDPDVAETPDTKAVAGAIGTSELAAPSFPENAYKHNKGSFGVKKNEGVSVDSEAEKIASETPAADSQEVGQPEPSGESYEGTPDSDSVPVPIEPPKAEPPPVGDLGDSEFPGYDRIPSQGQIGYSQSEIQSNIQAWKENVLYRIRKQFPEVGAFVSRGFEIAPKGGDISSEHFTGLAADITFGNKLDHVKMAEVANWVKNNISFEKLQLERDGNKRMHMHIEIPLPDPSGPTEGSRTVFTCGDETCSSSKEGIDIEYLYGNVPSTE